MGVVFSHAKGYTTIPELLPPLAFHGIISAVGLFCIAKSLPPKKADSEEQRAES